MSGYDWSKIKKYPPLREQMLQMIEHANGGKPMIEFDENGNPIISQEQYAVAAQNGITKRVLQGRINAGWELEKALTTPPMPRRKYSEHWISTAELNGISKAAFWERVGRCGWSEEKAATTTKEEANAERTRKLAAKIISPEEMDRARKNGIARVNVLYRLRNGWTREDALTVPIIPASQRKRRGKQLQEKKCGTKPECKGCAHAQREVTV